MHTVFHASVINRMQVGLRNLIKLLYVQYQALEVFAFGVIYVDRVIGRLGELVEYAHLAAALCGSAEYRKAELLFVYSL